MCNESAKTRCIPLTSSSGKLAHKQLHFQQPHRATSCRASLFHPVTCTKHLCSSCHHSQSGLLGPPVPARPSSPKQRPLRPWLRQPVPNPVSTGRYRPSRRYPQVPLGHTPLSCERRSCILRFYSP